jgi:hypothetical protein
MQYPMNQDSGPRFYPDWREDAIDRAEDAAYLFGYYLILHCRAEALKKAADASPETRQAVEEAVDLALHNAMDLLEGFWKTPAGEDCTAEFALQVNIRDKDRKMVESQAISPCKLDLPIGYWVWRNGQF